MANWSVLLRKSGNRFFILLCLGLVPLTGLADALPLHSPYPGGIAVIPLVSADAVEPRGYFHKRRIMVSKNQDKWYAIVGLSLSLKPGQHSIIRIDAQEQRHRHFFYLQDKKYPAQYITVKKKKWVTPNKKQLDRIIAERKIIIKALTTWSSNPSPQFQLVKPVQGRYSSAFGLRRFFNKKPRRPHSGIDIAAPTGTAIHAPAPGVILVTGDYYFNGKTVFIDHGQNMVSMLNHLSKITVTSGIMVKQGDKIGEVGSTGRVTGPHLHWSLSLNNTRVDPRIFLQEGVK